MLSLLLLAAGLPAAAQETVRIATYNVSLAREAPGALVTELEGTPSDQAIAVLGVLRTVRPDIVLLNEVDYDEAGRAVRALQALLAAPTGPGSPLDLPHAFSGPVNTGVDSGLDLDGDGRLGGPGDAWGYGVFPGQYGMVVLSRWPIERDDVRSFRLLRWADLPDALLPEDFYGETAPQLRLSSKAHWDVPIVLGDGRRLHALASHPTPPVFDGPEDRNGRRNADEIRFWSIYLEGDATLPVDDMGTVGGLPEDAAAVILGDLNADPADGDGHRAAIGGLLDHPRLQDPRPASDGAAAAAVSSGGANADHHGDPRLDTADFRDAPGPGNLRVDYVLPTSGLHVTDSGVFWPAPGEPGAELVAGRRASDHHLVWVDLTLE
ncbi:MAG: endonuclease/exonuclease/phosphatase family protein [Pseudomonadota bacterium]